MFTQGESRGNGATISMDFSTAEPPVQVHRSISFGQLRGRTCSGFITSHSSQSQTGDPRRRSWNLVGS
jgi:hypothetical protein